MHRRELLITAAAASVLTVGNSYAAQRLEKSPLEVSIALGKRMGKFRSLEYVNEHSHFPAVLRNTGEASLRVWREWCSWGYFALSFVATGSDGKPVKVTKQARDWAKNFPDFEEVDPGECVVRDVFFGSADWENFPRSADGAGNPLKLKAVFEIELDDDATKHGVWTGKIESPELDVRVFGLS